MRLAKRFLHIGSAARFAVPEKIIGLMLFLDFFDRCTQIACTASATGSVQAI